MQPIPPHSISMPVMTSGRRTAVAVFDQTEPAAHESAAPSVINVPTTLVRPLPVPIRSAATPPKPRIRPISCGPPKPPAPENGGDDRGPDRDRREDNRGGT